MKRRRTAASLHLPDSLLLEIFRYLSYPEICIISRVCRTWRRVASDASLRRTIDIRSTSLPLPKMKRFICSQCTKVVQKLQITGNGVILKNGKPSKHMVQFTPKCFFELENRAPNLQYLSVEKAVIVKDRGKSSTKEFEIPESITHLSLRNSFIHPSSSIQFSQVLQCLDLGNTGIDSSKRLLKLAYINNLKALYLDCCSRFSDEHIYMLMTLFRRLKVLDLEHTRVSNRGVLILIQQCARLTHLYLGHNQITHEPFLTMADGNLPALKELCLSCTRFNMQKQNMVRRRLPSLQVFSVSVMDDENVDYCYHSAQHSCKMINF